MEGYTKDEVDMEEGQSKRRKQYNMSLDLTKEEVSFKWPKVRSEVPNPILKGVNFSYFM